MPRHLSRLDKMNCWPIYFIQFSNKDTRVSSTSETALTLLYIILIFPHQKHQNWYFLISHRVTNRLYLISKPNLILQAPTHFSNQYFWWRSSSRRVVNLVYWNVLPLGSKTTVPLRGVSTLGTTHSSYRILLVFFLSLFDTDAY